MNLIEVTIKVTDSKSTVNVDKVESFDDRGDGSTLIVFSNSNITVKESYEEIIAKLGGLTHERH